MSNLFNLLAPLLIFHVCIAHGSTKDITNLYSLNSHIDGSDVDSSVGFLSEGNYHAVQNELSNKTLPKYYESKELLLSAVVEGEIMAGLVSGSVNDTDEFNVFGSDQISIRAMMVNQNEPDLLNALDAAIVRMIESGTIEKIAEKSHPYEALIVHSCKPSSDHFEWPVLLGNRTEIKIASLGPYNWGGTDGDYTVTPYVGFWPEYYNEMEALFKKNYGIGFKRVWYATSGEVLDSLKSGETDATEPYFMVGSAYGDDSRKTVFDLSCITSATQDKYVTLQDKEQDHSWIWIVLLIGLFVLFVLPSVGFVFYMYRRETIGDPLFAPIVQSTTNDIEMH
jgi:hypothetical protein